MTVVRSAQLSKRTRRARTVLWNTPAWGSARKIGNVQSLCMFVTNMCLCSSFVDCLCWCRQDGKIGRQQVQYYVHVVFPPGGVLSLRKKLACALPQICIFSAQHKILPGGNVTYCACWLVLLLFQSFQTSVLDTHQRESRLRSSLFGTSNTRDFRANYRCSAAYRFYLDASLEDSAQL